MERTVFIISSWDQTDLGFLLSLSEVMKMSLEVNLYHMQAFTGPRSACIIGLHSIIHFHLTLPLIHHVCVNRL